MPRRDATRRLTVRVPDGCTAMIKSSDGEVCTLLNALAADDPIGREAAIARLAIIGSRAVARLVAAYASAASDVQIGILRVLETSADERALPVARQALASGGERAVAAVGVLEGLLVRGSGALHTEALAVLLGVADDPATERRVRAAAVQVLEGASRDVRSALPEEMRAAASLEEAVWQDAREGRLPEAPEALRDAIEAVAGRAPLQELLKTLEAVRNRERSLAGRRAEAWLEVRGLLHQVLAARGSRIALYDLRESVEGARGPLPGPFLTALSSIGDRACLDAVGLAFARAREGDTPWRAQLAAAFQAIVARERLTSRHAAVRRVLAKAPIPLQ